MTPPALHFPHCQMRRGLGSLLLAHVLCCIKGWDKVLEYGQEPVQSYGALVLGIL